MQPKNWQWYNPPEETPWVEFCNDTTLHGLLYVGQQKRHFCERVFWMIAFLASGFAATFLVLRLYTEYSSMPIVTVFNPTEMTLDKIPFPAVTICNVNNIRKSKYIEYKKRFKEIRDEASLSVTGHHHHHSEYINVLASISSVEHICTSKKTFSERFTYKDIPVVETDDEIEKEIIGHSDEVYRKRKPIQTLRNGSQPCTEMILKCLWKDNELNCTRLFQEIETDFGSCCTFNMIPERLLKTSTEPDDMETEDDPKHEVIWNKLNYDTLLFKRGHKDGQTVPERQYYPGRSSGLSILLDPDLVEYDCTNTDSEGYMISLTEPLTFPKMRDNGIAVPTSSEVFISVRPEVTLYDESIRQFHLDKRQCYFGTEYELPHYSKYTAANCMSECVAKQTMQECKCKQHFMPRVENDTLCEPDKYNCTEKVRTRLKQQGLSKSCSYCLPTCTEIEYQTEATSLKIRERAVKNLLNVTSKGGRKNTTSSALSIVHVYFGVDAVYPRLRKEMITKIDLLSNAGGLLGLCMGFSALSVLEIVYYVTIRLFCSYYRKIYSNQKQEQQNITVKPHVNIIITKSKHSDMPTPDICTNTSGYWVHKKNSMNVQKQSKNLGIFRVVKGIGGGRRSGPRFVW